MALDMLQREIEAQARSEAGKIASEAESECDAIIGKAQKDAKSLKDSILENAKAESEQRRKDALISLDIESGSILANAKEERIDHELKGFMRILEERMLKREPGLVKAALERFVEVVPPERCVARTNKRNSKIVKPFGMELDYADVNGIVIESKDRKIRVDATINGTIESNAETIRRVLSKGIFG